MCCCADLTLWRLLWVLLGSHWWVFSEPCQTLPASLPVQNTIYGGLQVHVLLTTCPSLLGRSLFRGKQGDLRLLIDTVLIQNC